MDVIVPINGGCDISWHSTIIDNFINLEFENMLHEFNDIKGDYNYLLSEKNQLEQIVEDHEFLIDNLQSKIHNYRNKNELNEELIELFDWLQK